MLSSFWKNEDGFVTIEWLTLLSACVAMGIALNEVIGGGTGDFARDVGSELQTDNIDYMRTADSSEFPTSYGQAPDTDAQGAEPDSPAATVDWSWFYPLDPHHRHPPGNQGFGSNTAWADYAYSQWSQLGDSQVIAMYTENHDAAAASRNNSRQTRENVDNVVILEQILLERGYTVPNGNYTAQQLYQAHAVGQANA
ncbi:hypothetical protein HKCCE2091_09890 [Rhodobacterales bacterium HKCCE2091]|nr:hypothetical protein [Rhodobacterales bacterium HKCCE2091]